MKTSLGTSFAQLFGQQISDQPVIDRIKIPLIQRDYAQGRKGESVERIRADFLDAISAAVMPGGTAISLDFVYGDVENGTFYPLDGQQRLTTLFLLHWYLDWRSGVLDQSQPWTKFTYATRPGSRLFCERLVKSQPPAGEKCLSEWLTDQDWYFYTWKHDPTIQSMLVMLDAMHQRFCSVSDQDCAVAWQRLTDTQQPAVSFHVLPMEANGLTDDLYIKMNSRGKPLTAFENFKAHFEDMLTTAHPKQKIKCFADKVDTTWSDTLWPYRGEDNLIDDKFMRYFRFVTEVCAWLGDVSFDNEPRTDDLAEKVYGKNNTNSSEHLDFLFKAFDIWHQKNIKAEFENIFTAAPNVKTDALILFNAFDNAPDGESPVDLFAACCRLYGKPQWTFAHTLLLYAMLLSRIHNTDNNFPRQVRILRNLIEASDIRRNNMHKLLPDVKRIVVDCTLESVTAFNPDQVANENDKAALLEKEPVLQDTLYQLEDHTLLRGCLVAFDLAPLIIPANVIKRSESFHTLFSNPNCWEELTGTLLGIGDYSHNWQRSTGYRGCQFGVLNNNLPWRELIKGNKEPQFVNVLNSLLDKVAATNNDLTCLQKIQKDFLQECEASKKMDWRYYMVKYPVMRKGKSGRYTISPNGYSICMLQNPSMRGYYRDPYLLAVWHTSNLGDVLADPWFSGYETVPRKMVLKNSGIHIQCVDEGWQISEVPTDPTQKACFDQVFSKHGIGPDLLYAVPQNNGIDTSDRVELGAKLLIALVKGTLDACID